VSLDAILAAAQTGTPDPRPAGPFADPEREARAQAWDEEVEQVASTIWHALDDPGRPRQWPPFGASGELTHTAGLYRRMAAATIKVIEAERAGEAEGEWEWGVRVVHPDGTERVYGHKRSRESARDLAEKAATENLPSVGLVRRIAAGPWEPAPAEGGV
jgi:hypothetical protein